MDDAAATSRLFVTLWPDERVRAALRDYRKHWHWSRTAAAMHGDMLHLTLHFLGSQPQALLPDLLAALDVPVTPFALAFGRPGVWRHGSAVLEPLTAPDALLELHERIGHALHSVGVALEARPFLPHVTMGRHAAGSTAPLVTPHIDWQVDSFALAESLPEHGGYRLLRSYPAAP